MILRSRTPALEGDVLLTGGTGLVGSGLLRHLLRAPGAGRIHALSRNPERLPATAADPRVVPLRGDLTRPGLGVDVRRLRGMDGRVRLVVHAAADTRFSQTAHQARRTNVEGTRRLLEIAAGWTPPPRFVFVSTVFVAGRRTGIIVESPAPAPAVAGSPEREGPVPGRDGGRRERAGSSGCPPGGSGPGWVNEYERSKHRAEEEVRRSGLPWTVCRASTVVCDSPEGRVTQTNALHRALRVCFRGLAPMLPGDDATPVDVVPADYVSRAVAELAVRPDAVGGTYHLAAGVDAMPLGDLFDLTWDLWASLVDGRRALVRPVLTDLETYRLFERSVLETAEPRLRRVTRALSHFVPQLAYPKRFATVGADRALDHRPPPVRDYWPRMLARLAAAWGVGDRECRREP